MIRKISVILLASTIPLLGNTLAYAEIEKPNIEFATLTSEFPNGFRIKVKATGETQIESVAVRFKIGQQTSGVYEYLCQSTGIKGPEWRCEDFEPGQVILGEFFWRTNTLSRYIPPGTIINYNFEIEDSSGQVLSTESREFVYSDSRFKWSDISEGPVTVSYYGPVKTRAGKILKAILETINKMGAVLGSDMKQPIRVTAYNTIKDMLDALPPGSTTIRRELVTEGQAFTNVGTLLVLQGGRLAIGTASHEVTHILVHRAGDGIFGRVPSWLHEGLAEYANVDPSYSYDTAMEFAAANDRLLPVVYMDNLPGTPEDIVIFYGQSRSVVRFMINQFGQQKMKNLMSSLKKGGGIDTALQEVYGFDRQGLDDMWRDDQGISRYEPPKSRTARPTPAPRAEILPYSLTPQPSTETNHLENPSKNPISDKQIGSTTNVKDRQTSSGCNIRAIPSETHDIATLSIVLSIGIIGFLRHRNKP